MRQPADPRICRQSVILILLGMAWGLVPLPQTHAQSPEIKAVIQRGVSFLRTQLGARNAEGSDGRRVLSAYAVVKAGVPPTSKDVAGVIGSLKKRTAGGKYRRDANGIYSAGCELMLLEAAEVARKKPGLYRSQMQLIVDFIVKNQSPQGYWNYLGGDPHGDTSVTQYGALGLWAAERAGVDVPPSAWDKVARWLISAQRQDGGFAYRPTRPDASSSTLSMTVAGVSTLLVARRYLYPNQDPTAKKTARKKPKRRTGILQKVDIDGDASQKKSNRKKKRNKPGNYKPVVSFAQITGSIRAGLAMLSKRYETGGGGWPIYTLYGVERLAALANIETIGTTQWFPSGTKYLLKKERSGQWDSGRSGPMASTSFAILFLGRFTGKLLNRAPPEFLGAGVLRGGVGLPDDLSSISEGKAGKIKKRKISGPLDELLADLQKPKNLDVPAIQKAIVEKIQLGNRKIWLQPKRRNQLLRMANHPDPEVRKVAVWALGHTGNIDVVSVIMTALEKDPDLDVAIHARNALCWLSRKPNGFGLPEKPQVPDDADKAQRLRLVTQWRREAVRRWKKWYLSVRPYEERDDLREIKPRR